MKKSLLLGSALLGIAASPAYSMTPQARIFSGTVVSDSSGPAYFAKLEIWTSMTEYYQCGATLVTPTKLVTAAHCFGEVDAESPVKVTFENGRSTWTDQWTQDIHWNPHNQSNDFAVVNIASHVPGSTPVKVATEIQTRVETSSGAEVTAYGYGKINSDQVSDELRSVNLNLITNPVCSYRWQEYGSHTDVMICTVPTYSNPNGSTCNGDSGGPLVANWGNGDYLIGITSFGTQDCSNSLPSVYSRPSMILGKGQLLELAQRDDYVNDNLIQGDEGEPELNLEPNRNKGGGSISPWIMFILFHIGVHRAVTKYRNKK